VQVRDYFGAKPQVTKWGSSKLLIRGSGVRIPPGALIFDLVKHGNVRSILGGQAMIL
jgi:hypothetical protein